MTCGTLFEAEPYLKGLMYPATKEEVIQQVKKNDADQVTLETFEKINPKKFYSHIDMVNALEEVLKMAEETEVPRKDETKL